jgi:hypothetical protein
MHELIANNKLFLEKEHFEKKCQIHHCSLINNYHSLILGKIIEVKGNLGHLL